MAKRIRRDEGSRNVCSINRPLLPVKAFYFTFLAAVGSLLPFIAIYMKQLGLTSNETGVIYGVMPFLSFLMRTLVGALADRWQKHKAVLILCTLLSAVLHLLIMFVPPRTSANNALLRVKPVFLHCGLTESVLSSCLGDGDEQGVSAETSNEIHDSFSSSLCSVSLEKLAQQVLYSKREMTDKYNSDNFDNNEIQSSSDGTEQSETKSNSDTRNILNVHSSCSFRCYTLNKHNSSIQGNHYGNKSSGMCFTDPDLPETSQGRCHGLQVYDDPIEFISTALPQLLNRTQTETSDGEVSPSICDKGHYTLAGLYFEGESFDKLRCPDSKTFKCEVECRGVVVSDGCVAGATRLDLTFGLLFVVSFFASSAFSPVFSLADTIIFDQLGPERHKYGQQRMWGTLGLAIFAVTSTFVVNARSSDVSNSDVNYDVMFYLFAGLCTLSALIATSIKISSRVRCHSLVRNACQILILPEVLAFLGVVLHLGMITGAMEGFLFWFLADLGGGPLLFGLCLAVNCVFEIPFFFFSGAIIKRLKPITCLYSSMLVLSVRLLIYSFLGNPWYVLLAESLHGVTFGITWAAVANHAHAISPPGMSASVQGLVGGVNFGIGKGVGSLITGLLFSAVGERWTFRLLAISCLVVLAVYALLNTYAFTDRPGTGQNNLAQHSPDRQESGKRDEEDCPGEHFIANKTEDDDSPT